MGLRTFIGTWRPDFGNPNAAKPASENALHGKKSHFFGDVFAKSDILVQALDAISSGFHVKLQQLVGRCPCRGVRLARVGQGVRAARARDRGWFAPDTNRCDR